MKRKKEKRSAKEQVQRRRVFRVGVVYSIVFLSFASLIFRASYVQVVKGKQFRQSELRTQINKVPVLPERGWIYDTNGQVLAYDQPSTDLILDRYTTLSNAKYHAMSRILSPLLHLSAKSLYATMIGNQGLLQVTLATSLSDKQVAYIMEHKSELPSTELVQDYSREYPNGVLAGHVLGYMGAITAADEQLPQFKNYLPIQKIGTSGIEEQYENLLQGKPGYELVSTNSLGQPIGNTGSVPPINGDNIQLTLDGHEEAETQMIMQQQIQKLGTSVSDAAAVMMNVKTGGVISMVSYPYWDPNWYTNGSYLKHLKYISQPGAQVNNAIDSYNYPGSTVKPANMLAAMKAGVVTPNTIYQDNGYIYVGTQRINEDQGIVFGAVDPIRAITVSSDVYFYQVGLSLGKWYGSSTSSGGTWPTSAGNYQNYLDTDFVKGLNTLFQGEENFGLGLPSGIDLPGEASGNFDIEDYQKGNIQVPYDLKASEESIKKTGQYVNYGSPATLADAAIGQSQQFTPMQLAEYVMTLANRGVKLQPHLLQDVYNANGTPNNSARPMKSVKRTVESRVKGTNAQFTLIKEGMLGVATNPSGTAYNAFGNAPYQAAGKTGTAQIYINGKATDNSVFICYAPVNHPLVAVAVMAPGGGYGASFSAIIARQMIDAYFDEHHESFMPKKDWTTATIPANWKTSPAYKIPEMSK